MTDKAYSDNPNEGPKDTVWVRAKDRGEHGLLIRNVGETFQFDTSKMRIVPPKMKTQVVDGKMTEVPIGGPIPDDAVIIETPKGKFELPPWVELASSPGNPLQPEEVATGHKTTFRKQDDVL